MKIRSVGLVLFFILLGGSGLYAQEKAGPEAKPVDITAAKVEYSVKNGKDLTRFVGGVTFSADKYKFTADLVEVYQGGDNLVADGKITFFYRDREKQQLLNGKSDHLEYDKVSGYLLTTGSPFIKIEQAEDGNGNSEPRSLEIAAEKIEAWTKEDRALASGRVRITRPGFRSKSEVAEFFLEEEKVVLTGSPEVARKGGSFSGEKITIFIKAGNMIIEGNVRGQVIPSEESNDQTSGAGSSPTSP